MLKPITSLSVERISALVIGKAGIGKTSLIRTIPIDEPVCVLSAESGLLCVIDLVRSGRVKGLEISSLEDFQEALDAFKCRASWTAEFKWVFIDSLTEISDRCLEYFQEKFPNKVDTFKLWGAYADRMTAIIKAFRDLAGFNVVFTCLEDIIFDEVKRKSIGPLMAGAKLKGRLLGYFDEALYMTVDSNGKRVFYTNPNSGFPCKDRSGKLEDIEQPNLAHIVAKILGE